MNEVTVQIVNPDGSVNSELKVTPADFGTIGVATAKGTTYAAIDDSTPLVQIKLPMLDAEKHPDGVADMPGAPSEPAEEPEAVTEEAPVEEEKTDSGITY